MKIEKLSYTIKCDMNGCNNRAGFAVRIYEDNKKGQLHFCEKCASEINNELSKMFVPKSIKNKLNTKPKQGDEFIEL